MKKRGSPKNEAQIALIRELAAQGHSQTTIGLMIGRSRERIRQICDREGIETLCGLIYHDRDDRILALIAEGLSYTEIGLQIGVPAGTVQQSAKRLGVKPIWKGKRPGVSGVRGVSPHKKTGLWQAYINDVGRVRSLGYYDTKEAAIAARLAAEAAQVQS